MSALPGRWRVSCCSFPLGYRMGIFESDSGTSPEAGGRIESRVAGIPAPLEWVMFPGARGAADIYLAIPVGGARAWVEYAGHRRSICCQRQLARRVTSSMRLGGKGTSCVGGSLWCACGAGIFIREAGWCGPVTVVLLSRSVSR